MTDLLPVISTSTFLSTFRIQVIAMDSLHIRTVDVVVQTDSIRIHYSSPHGTHSMSIEPTATVFDLLNTMEKQSAWYSCTLNLSPPSNVASPMAAPADPNEPYDDTVRFLTPGDYVDMGDHRIEYENMDQIPIYVHTQTNADEIMKLNPSAIHGGVFVIRLK